MQEAADALMANQGAIVNSIIERTRHEATDEMLPGPSDAAKAHLGEWRERRNTPTDNERVILGDIWDDGNAVGLDGWVGPGRGTEPIDDYAVQARERAIEKFAAALHRTEVPEPSSLPDYFAPKPMPQVTFADRMSARSDDELGRMAGRDEIRAELEERKKNGVWVEHAGHCNAETRGSDAQGEPSDAQVIERLRGQIEEARNAWWSATEQGDNGLVYTDRIEDAMDGIWSAIGHADWTPDAAGGAR